jgi:hypothetical protein
VILLKQWIESEDYWYNQWQYDFELHNRLGIKMYLQSIKENVSVSMQIPIHFSYHLHLLLNTVLGKT